MLDETISKTAYAIYKEHILPAMHSLRDTEEFDKKFLFHNKDGTEVTSEVSYDAFEEYLENAGKDFSEEAVWESMQGAMYSVLAMYPCDIVTKIYDGFMTYDLNSKAVTVTTEEVPVDKKIHPLRHCNRCIVFTQHLQKQEGYITRLVPYAFEDGNIIISDTVFKI